MIIKNIKTYSPSGILTVSPPIKEGMEKITPNALTKPEASPVRDRAKILPMASSLLLIGEISIEANVPFLLLLIQGRLTSPLRRVKT